MTILLVLSAIAFGAAIYLKSFVIGLLALTILCLSALATIKHRLLKNLLMFATSVFASWTVLEGALFLIEPSLKAEVTFFKPDTDEPRYFWRTSEAYGVLPSKGAYRARKIATSGEVVYDVIYTVGADGFRLMPEPDDAAIGGVYFLGGSATFGEGLNDDQTLPRHFSTHEPGRKVHNKADSGWGLHQVYALWTDEIEEPGATIIVQTAPWHADRAACIPKFSGLSPRYEMIDGDLLRTGRCRTWFDSKILSSMMLKSSLLQRLYDLSNRQNRAARMELYLGMLDRMNQLATDRGQCFVVAFNKALDIYLRETGYTNDQVIGSLIELGIDVVDTTLADKKEDLDLQYYIVGDGHPSNEANRVKADLLSTANERCEQELLASTNDR